MKKSTWVLLGVIFIILVIGAVFVLTQTQPMITKTVQVTLNIVLPPDIDLTANVTELTAPIGREATFVVSVTSLNNFDGEVVFSISDVPTGVTVTILPSDTLILGAGETKGVQINIDIPDDVNLVGAHVINVTIESTIYN